MSSSDNQTLLISSREDVHSIVDQQQSKFHHIQSQTQGLLTIFIGIATITATIYFSAFDGNLPSISYTNSESVASQFGVDPSVITMVVGFNLLFAFTIFLAGSFSLFKFLSDTANIIAQDSPQAAVPSTANLLHEPGPKVKNVLELSRSDTVNSRLLEQYQSNQKRIEKASKNYRVSIFRVILIISTGLVSAQVYFWSSEMAVMNLLSMNVFFGLVPFSEKATELIPFDLPNLLGASSTNSEFPSLMETAESMDDGVMTLPEKVFYVLSSVISLIIVGIWIVFSTLL